MKTKAFKKTLSICLSLLMALGVLALPAGILPTLTAHADTWDGNWDGSGFSNNHITSARGFAQFINNAGTGTSYSGQTVYLDVDIDLNQIDFGNISGGKNVYYSKDNYFQGTFDGQGHTIYHFRMQNSDHRVAIFRSARGATFKNFTVDGIYVDDNDNNKKNGFAVVVGYGEGNITFENVHLKNGIVYGYNYVGGLIGEYGANETLRITNCTNNATIHADNDRAGGMVGHSKGSVVANGCSNAGEIYAGYSDAGGIAGWIEDDESSFVNCSNTGKVSTDACAGGIFGYYGSKSQDKKMTLNGCSNTGYIESRAKVAGGIAGMIDTDAEHSFENNVNRGQVYGRDDAGGIVGSNNGAGVWRDNKNYGDVSCANDNAGGILGEVEDDKNEFKNCYNTGGVTGKNSVGGILGYGNAAPHVFNHCGNGGAVTSTNDSAGGIYGYGGNTEPTIEECWNIGTIKAYNDAGGILGHTNHHSYIRRCFNVGSIETYNHNDNGAHGGIVGQTSDLSGSSNSNPNMTDCFNWGPVSGGRDDGGLIGKIKDGKTSYCITNSYNAGTVSGTRPFAIIAYGGNVGNNVYYNSDVAMGTVQGTPISENDLVNSSGFSGNYCRNTWGVSVKGRTYKFPILTWYRDMFHFKLWFLDNPTGTNVYMDNNYGTGWGAPDVSRTGFTPSDWLREDNHSQTIARGSTVWLGVSSPTDQYTVTQDTSDLTHIYNETNHIIEWTKNQYYLDVNGYLDADANAGGVGGYGTFDMYVNGNLVADDVEDFWQQIYYEDTYEIRDIKAASGKAYVGVTEGALSGTMGADAVNIRLQFKTQYTVTFKDVLGNTLKTETVLFGDDATAPTAPEYLQKTNDAENHYHFLGTWDTAFTNVTSDLTVTADYETAAHAYGTQASDGDTTHSRVCENCGYTETNDHNWTWVTDTYADCGNPGLKHEVCSVCGATRSLNTVIDPTGEHTFTAETVTDAALVSGADCEHAAVYYYSCAVCGAVEGNDAHTFTDGDPLDHAWGEPTYEWANDGHSVTATRTCNRDGEHVETETRTLGDGITATEKTPANCTEKGWTTYTATFTNPAFGTKQKDVQDIPTNEDHDYGFDSFVWGADCTTAEAKYVCSRNPAHVKYETAEVTPDVHAATCTADAYTVYTAVYDGHSEDKTVTQEGTKTGHHYAEPAETDWVWTASGETYTVKVPLTCEENDHTFEAPAVVGVAVTPATHTEDGSKVFTATVTVGEQTFTSTRTDVIRAEGHHFETLQWDGEYHWYKCTVCDEIDGKTAHTGGEATCSAQAVCDVCRAAYGEYAPTNHKHTVSVSAVTPDCVTEGFTAGVLCTDCGKYVSGHTTLGLDVSETGHDYGAWISNNDGTHTKTCSRCEPSVENHTVTGNCTGGVATCSDRAVCEWCGAPYGEKAPHDYAFIEFVWEADYSAARAKFVCRNNSEHEKYEDAVVMPVEHDATCDADAYTDYTAVYGDYTETKTVTQTGTAGHKLTYVAAVPGVDCQHFGTVEHWVCDACGKVFSDADAQNLLEDLSDNTYGEHNWQPVVDVEPSCDATGIGHEECAVCHQTRNENTVLPPAGEHSWDDGVWTKRATCLESGTKFFTCTRCGAVKYEDVDALGHDIKVLAAREPTCTDRGITEGTMCRRCNAVLTPQIVISELGHDYGAWETVTPATCTEAGSEQRICRREGCTEQTQGHAEEREIPATGHMYGEWEITRPATCTEAGEKARKCVNCDETLTAEIPATGHFLGEWTESSAPTCTENGSRSSVCSACGETVSVVVPALGHDYRADEGSTATCTEGGTAVYTCSRCGDSYSEEVAALGHDWGERKTVKAASPTEKGLERRACARCGATEERETEFTGVMDRTVQFVAGVGLDIVVHLGDTDYIVRDQSSKAIGWYASAPLTFEVRRTGRFSADGFVVLVNQQTVAPDADGVYTLPAGSAYAIVSAEPLFNPTPVTPSTSDGVCKLCGKDHGSTFWGRIVAFFHMIVWFFKNLFKF